MPSKSRGARSKWNTWPKKALGLFIAVIIAVYALVFFTGDRLPKPNLGIDLQGGTRITLVPQGEQPTQDQLAQARNILENRVNGMGVSGAKVITDGNTLVITVPGEDTAQARSLGKTSQLVFRPVAQVAPTDADFEALPAEMEKMANRWVSVGALTADQANERLKQLAEDLTKLKKQNDPEAKELTPAKVSAKQPQEAVNSLEAEKQRKELADVLLADRQADTSLKQLSASFLLRCDSDKPDLLQGADDPALPLVTCDPSAQQAMILGPSPVLEGQDANQAQAKRLTGNEVDTNEPITGGFDAQSGKMQITFKFKSAKNEKGSETWAKLTNEYVGRQVAITLDSEVLSAPQIEQPTPVGERTAITSSTMTQAQTQELANNLRYGALPLSFVGENGESGGTAITVPASLGIASLKAGLIAGLVGLIAVALYSLYFYRFFGLISLLSLGASFALVYGALVLLGRLVGYSLDLAGIAGLIIGIGTTADSFVVLYERIKDEVRDGRTFRSAVAHGWDRAKQTIITGNAVTLIAAVIIYALAVGEVKGFAFTLGLTTVFDILVTFLVTAPLVILASRKPWSAKHSVNGLGKVFALARHTAKEAQPVLAQSVKESHHSDTQMGMAKPLASTHRDAHKADDEQGIAQDEHDNDKGEQV
ncbi:protein translocase subunit SecD [Corynebacterium sp. sy017]|uniref:protein translocase subunit SecD n=1 Tax=unclassified Corynebacterium TaxID=2624378 RepID=UPI001186B943|nr:MULTISPECIES: protein translocase subunit SecD [unclassified Corynebacterium]MBP3087719.1 protein translocase subunit SecD [Corynebacterium sp. sy017]TSD92273.1 protein translocase subunit SecD [Corynebacterium sp. SY003]